MLRLIAHLSLGLSNGSELMWKYADEIRRAVNSFDGDLNEASCKWWSGKILELGEEQQDHQLGTTPIWRA